MIIKAARLQAWTPAGGGARVGRRHPPHPPKKIIKTIFLAILGALLLLFLHMGALIFAAFFSFLWAFLLLFTSWWGPFFGIAPPPYENFCGRP